MEYLVIIPARGGSKGLPNKNLRQLHGKPLIAWTIQHAINTKRVTRTVVSTDSTRISKVAVAFGAEVPFRRPAKLSGDKATTESTLLHCLKWLEKKEHYRPDAVILLQCTSPLRRKQAISRAIKQFESDGADSLVSVSPFYHFLWQKTERGAKALYDFKNRPRRQDILAKDIRYKENGSIYITKTEVLKKQLNRLGGKVSLFEMSEEEGHEIDTLMDFQQVEQIMHGSPKFRS